MSDPAKKNDLKTLGGTKMLLSGLGHMTLLVVAFIIHPLLGGLYIIYWAFILPFLTIRKMQKEAENNCPDPDPDPDPEPDHNNDDSDPQN